MMKYTAALLYGPHDIRLEEMEMPPVQPGEVLIRMRAATLCPTDVKKYRGINPKVADALKTHGPYVLGHEGGGDVVETGHDVTTVKPGDRVAVQPIISCGECYYCQHDMPNLCPQMLGIGAAAGDFGECVKLYHKRGIGGCFAEYLKAPESCVIKVPKDLDYEAASMIEPVSDVVHSVSLANTGAPLRKRVVVTGLGPMGVTHVMVAKAFGAESVIGLDPIQERRNLAMDLGANVVIDPSQDNPVDRVLESTEGTGADIVFVTAGGKAQVHCVTEAIDMVRKGGAVVLFASSAGDSSLCLDHNVLHYKMVQVIGVVGFRSQDAEKTINLMKNAQINLDAVRGPVLPLSDAEKGFSIYGSPGVMKVGLDIN